MLAGRPPFTAKRVGDFGVKLLNSTPLSLRALNPEVNVVIEARYSAPWKKTRWTGNNALWNLEETCSTR